MQRLLAPKISAGKCTYRYVYAREEIFFAKDTGGLSFWELWITSGLVAKLTVQVAIINFGRVLLKLADPFCVCNGTYDVPPNDFGYRRK
jgi:hypothetical protein